MSCQRYMHVMNQGVLYMYMHVAGLYPQSLSYLPSHVRACTCMSFLSLVAQVTKVVLGYPFSLAVCLCVSSVPTSPLETRNVQGLSGPLSVCVIDMCLTKSILYTLGLSSALSQLMHVHSNKCVQLCSQASHSLQQCTIEVLGVSAKLSTNCSVYCYTVACHLLEMIIVHLYACIIFFYIRVRSVMCQQAASSVLIWYLEQTTWNVLSNRVGKYRRCANDHFPDKANQTGVLNWASSAVYIPCCVFMKPPNIKHATMSHSTLIGTGQVIDCVHCRSKFAKHGQFWLQLGPHHLRVLHRP